MDSYREYKPIIRAVPMFRSQHKMNPVALLEGLSQNAESGLSFSFSSLTF